MVDAAEAKRIFMAALALSPPQRVGFIKSECGGNDALRLEIEKLLAAHDQGPLLHSATAFAGGQGLPPPQNPPIPGMSAGDQVGPYRLLERIGEGGFGEVWVAEQKTPVRRKVALKIIKAGMDTKEVLARFDAERQALAVMDHPNVAKVFDAGATESGRPYFVMEHVAGLPIDKYCDTSRMKVKDRLKLFIDICQAIQHAHQKGIIHRDLKPSNILVTLHDGKPVPKVIDFGIAKATIGRLTERTLYTETGRMIGTPEYMAPEQASTTGLDIDTRADIYSLGVILFQLLTGTLPFDAKTLRGAGFDGIAKILNEMEPPKPSTRLSTMETEAVNRATGATPHEIAKSHGVEFQILQRELRGDLDWITLKALEKDRGRRYETASAFAADVERHLSGAPVFAAPPSASYKLKKFARSHRWGLALSSTCALALTSSALFIIERQHKQLKDRELAESEVARAADAYRLGHPKEAEAILEKFVQLDPHNYMVMCNRANQWINDCRDKHDCSHAVEAFTLLDDAIRLDPKRPHAFNYKGLLLRVVGRLDQAINILQQGCELDKGFYPIRATLAITLVEAKRWDDAQHAALEATALNSEEGDPRPWLRWHNLAAIDWALGSPRAAEDIERALGENGGRANPKVRLLEARIRLESSDSAVARGALDSARMADDLSVGSEYSKAGAPEPYLLKRILALGYLRNEDWAKAAAVADEALALKDPYPAFAGYVKAIAAARMAKKDDVAGMLRVANEAWPKNLAEEPQGVVALPPSGGVLWLEKLAEFKALKSQADAIIKGT